MKILIHLNKPVWSLRTHKNYNFNYYPHIFNRAYIISSLLSCQSIIIVLHKITENELDHDLREKKSLHAYLIKNILVQGAKK